MHEGVGFPIAVSMTATVGRDSELPKIGRIITIKRDGRDVLCVIDQIKAVYFLGTAEVVVDVLLLPLPDKLLLAWRALHGDYYALEGERDGHI